MQHILPLRSLRSIDLSLKKIFIITQVKFVCLFCKPGLNTQSSRLFCFTMTVRSFGCACFRTLISFKSRCIVCPFACAVVWFLAWLLWLSNKVQDFASPLKTIFLRNWKTKKTKKIKLKKLQTKTLVLRCVVFYKYSYNNIVVVCIVLVCVLSQEYRYNSVVVRPYYGGVLQQRHVNCRALDFKHQIRSLVFARRSAILNALVEFFSDYYYMLSFFTTQKPLWFWNKLFKLWKF